MLSRQHSGIIFIERLLLKYMAVELRVRLAGDHGRVWFIGVTWWKQPLNSIYHIEKLCFLEQNISCTLMFILAFIRRTGGRVGGRSVCVYRHWHVRHDEPVWLGSLLFVTPPSPLFLRLWNFSLSSSLPVSLPPKALCLFCLISCDLALSRSPGKCDKRAG